MGQLRLSTEDVPGRGRDDPDSAAGGCRTLNMWGCTRVNPLSLPYEEAGLTLFCGEGNSIPSSSETSQEVKSDRSES